jgi:hypothetical protein
MVTTELDLWVTSQAGFECWSALHGYNWTWFGSEMKTRVKTVTAAPEEDGVDYNVIINFTTSYNGVVCVCVCVCVR